MFAAKSSLFLLAAAAAPALATVYVTSPVASTSWAAGSQVSINWQDDGTSPSLSEFGASKVSVYVGSKTQQVMVQSLTDSVDVSTTSSIAFTPDASSGENGQYYFIRFESLSLKDSTNTAYPALAFSSKYTMTGMSGTFNTTVQAAINSDTSSSAGASSTAGSSSASSAATTSKTASSTKSSASSTGTAAASSSDSGAAALPISALSCAAGVALAVFSSMFM